MNIIDAIKSGRRFKRKVWPHYPAENTFCQNDIIADDWEVEEISCYAGSVTITRAQFDAAWDNALLMIGTSLGDALAKELGL